MRAVNAQRALDALCKATLVRTGRDQEAAEARVYLRAYIAQQVEAEQSGAEQALAAVRAELEAQDADILRYAQHYDHACRQCTPDGPVVIEGFACAYHRALARATKPGAAS